MELSKDVYEVINGVDTRAQVHICNLALFPLPTTILSESKQITNINKLYVVSILRASAKTSKIS